MFAFQIALATFYLTINHFISRQLTNTRDDWLSHGGIFTNGANSKRVCRFGMFTSWELSILLNKEIHSTH